MRLWIAILSFVLMGMAGPRPEIPDEGAATAAQPYYENFKTLATQYGAVLVAKSVSFFFSSFIGSTVGVCRFSGSGRNTVELSTSAWNRGSATFREMLVFHELGHCLLGRGHKNGSHSDGRPESVMASRMFSERAYLANKEQYMKELFTVGVRRSIAKISRSRETFDDCQFGH